MSKKEKVKIIKEKKKVNWFVIFKFLRTLWRNDAVVEVATTTGWYWSLIVFVLALGISVLPATVSQATAQGSNFIGATNLSYSDSYYNGLYDYATSEEAPLISFNKESKKLEEDTPVSAKYENYKLADELTNAYKPIYSYVRENDGKKENYLDIYVVKTSETETLNSVLNNVQNTNTNFADGYTTDTSVKHTRSNPFILFTTDGFYAVNYSANGSTSLSGNFAHIQESFNALKDTYTLKDILLYKVTLGKGTIHEDQEAIFNNFLKYCDSVYIDVCWQSTWVTFGIYCGVNGSIMILMGLIIWLMTRGKNNPNNKTKIWEAYSMAFWSSSSPALLSLFGFLFPQIGMMLFIMLYAFRVMFLSMRQLRPVYQ